MFMKHAFFHPEIRVSIYIARPDSLSDINKLRPGWTLKPLIVTIRAFIAAATMEIPLFAGFIYFFPLIAQYFYIPSKYSLASLHM
jgi:hypothetical protein